MLQNATLYVPKDALDQYKNTSGWKDFQHIEAIDDGSDGISAVNVNGNDNGKVYDLQGRRIGTGTDNLLPNTIYIINGKKIVKR